MTTAMNCDLFTGRLMDYLEQETDDVTRLAMERHAVTCEDCGPLLADMRKLRIDAANLPVLKPSRDLWAGIAERIETPVVALGSQTNGRGSRPAARRRWLNGAVMAASLVGAAALGHLSGVLRASRVAGTSAETTTSEPVAAAPALRPAEPGADSLGVAPTASPARVAAREPASSAGTTGAPAASGLARLPEVQYALATLTADYDREINRLRRLMDARRDQLDPGTVAIIERNLAVIDTAIAESKAAIVRDPASRFLIESLNQSLQTKVELMRTAAVLPGRS